MTLHAALREPRVLYALIRQPRVLVFIPLGFIILGYIVYPAALVLWESLFREGQFGFGNYGEFFDPEYPSYM